MEQETDLFGNIIEPIEKIKTEYPKGLNVGYLTANRDAESDECLTPRYAVSPIVKYLKIGKELGLCQTYNPRESEIRSHCKCVAVYNNDGEITDVFRSMTEASMRSKDVLGVDISIPMIGLVCNGISKTAKGFKMSIISYEDYMYYNEILNEQCKMIKNNNEVVLKEAI